MSVPSPAEHELSQHRVDIETALSRLFTDDGRRESRLRDAMRYAVMSPGKRVRPLLALACAQSLGIDSMLIVQPACALELVHTASLVLDDMPCMDNSPLRRNRPAVHIAFGEDIASLSVVALLAEAYAMVARTPSLRAEACVEVMAIISRAIGLTGLAAGQEMDLRRDSATYAEFDEMHRLKTSALFAAAVDIVSVVADAPASQRKALQRFATELGIAFQALDDLADATDSGGADGSNVVSVLGKESTRRTVARSLREAGYALREAGSGFVPLSSLVDHLFARSESAAGR